jgi:ABC-type multidrug transport system fused ATPase/permease subunit
MAQLVPADQRFVRLRQCLGLLSISDKKKVLAACVLQSTLSVFDLVGVALIGLIGSLAVSGVQSRSPSENVSDTLEFIGINNLTFQYQAAILGIVATLFMVGKTLISIYLSRRILYFVARRGSIISRELAGKFFSKGLIELQRKSSQQSIFALTRGVQGITLGIIGTGIILVADFSLLILLLGVLLFVDVVTAVFSLIIFGLVGFFLYTKMHKKASIIARNTSELEVNGSEILLEFIQNFREYFVKSARMNPLIKFEKNRESLAINLAELSLMPILSKYIVEASLLISALMIAAIQFSLQDASTAVATLSVFLAAGSRIAPAALRLQQGLVIMKGNIAGSSLTFDLITEIQDWNPSSNQSRRIGVEHIGFIPQIVVKDLGFTYSRDQENDTICNVNLIVEPGEFLAIVGKSGAGKSTLVDAMLGLVEPNCGSVHISNLDPRTAINSWPGAIAYVPQDPHLLNGTLRSNVCLGFDPHEFTDEQILSALSQAKLGDFLLSLNEGLDTQLGDFGAALSGGQLQRLSIARALLTKPRLLFLDEATSSLDAQTEASINETLRSLTGSTTVVVVAHRLSTVKNADKVAYVADGQIKAIGSFEKVRRLVPDLELQAQLLGF